MKIYPFTISLFLLCMPIGIFGQYSAVQKSDFFKELAQNDAHYELDLNLVDVDDEMDYWTDQKEFEKALQRKQPKAYQVYMLEKYHIYNAHKKGCSEKHIHSELFLKNASIYLMEGNFNRDSNTLLSADNTNKRKMRSSAH